MWEVISGIIGIGIAAAASRWSYARTLLTLAQEGLGLVKQAGLNHEAVEAARKVAEQSIIAANQREIAFLVDKLLQLQKEGRDEERAAIERGKANADGIVTELVERDGDEEFTSPWGK